MLFQSHLMPIRFFKLAIFMKNLDYLKSYYSVPISLMRKSWILKYKTFHKKMIAEYFRILRILLVLADLLFKADLMPKFEIFLKMSIESSFFTGCYIYFFLKLQNKMQMQKYKKLNMWLNESLLYLFVHCQIKKWKFATQSRSPLQVWSSNPSLP